MGNARDALRAANERNRSEVALGNGTTNLIDEVANPTNETLNMEETISSTLTTQQDIFTGDLQKNPKSVLQSEQHSVTPVKSRSVTHNQTQSKANIIEGITISSSKKRVKDKIFSVRLYPDVYEQLDILAKEKNSSVNDVINQILSQVFNLG